MCACFFVNRNVKLREQVKEKIFNDVQVKCDEQDVV